ncbi:MAG TPA: putative metal-binding motif-containing protein [Minicystis sp.]|nr:putative metal-binding motif-containing protein [Minicystis sp.]
MPGHRAGDPGSCGDDCDDTNPAAHPGAVEICDGVDNDCNGIIDDGQTFVPVPEDPVRISGDIAPAAPGGLAWSGTSYAAMYTGVSGGGFQMFSQLLSPTGQSLAPGEFPFVLANGDSSGGPIVWIGDRYATAWDDRRSGDYEIYFAEMQDDGRKIWPGDIRMTFAPGFSINPTLTWTGAEFVLAWEDDRNGSGLFDVFAQRVALDGSPIGDNVQLTQPNGDFGNESPIAAAGLHTVGFTWSFGNALEGFIEFQPWALDLSAPAGPSVSLTSGATQAVYPTIVWNHDRYIVAWFDRTASPAAIYAAALDEAGNVLVAPRPVTAPGAFRSRYPNLRALGDRILVLYADDRDQNDGYELYSRVILPDLSPASPEQRITFAAGDSIYPFGAFGPKGDLGIVFRDDRLNGDHHVWFTRLACVPTTTP